MREGLNQYAVYRLRRDLRETRSLRRQSWLYLQKHKIKVEPARYTQAYLAEFEPPQSVYELRTRLEKELPRSLSGGTLSVGDILAVTRDGITEAFYVDPENLVPVPDFFHVRSPSDAVTMDTSDFQIQGRPGNWVAVDELWLDGHHFFLMQSMQFGSHAAYAVVDSRGRQATQDTLRGFTDEVKRQLREHIGKQDTLRDKESLSTEEKEALRAEEKDEEKKQDAEPPGTLPVHERTLGGADEVLTPLSYRGTGETTPVYKKKRRRRRRRKGKIPLKRRESVLKRLRMYQKMIMERYGNI